MLPPKYKIYFDKTKQTYFVINEAKDFDKTYMELLEKVNNIVKKH